MSVVDPKRTSFGYLLPIMVLKETSALIAEAELRLVEGEKRIRKQRAIVARLERASANTEQTNLTLSCRKPRAHRQSKRFAAGAVR
jgi:hypothetical protein